MRKRKSERKRNRVYRLTFLQRSSLVLLQPLDCDGFQTYPGGRIFLQHVPHVLLAEDEEVRVADRAHAGCSPVTCVDVAIYWLSRCIKLSYVTARKIERASIYIRRATRNAANSPSSERRERGCTRDSECTLDTFTRDTFPATSCVFASFW